MRFPFIAKLTLPLVLASCASQGGGDEFDFWSQDRTNGIFFEGHRIAIGSVIYAEGKPIQKGVEGKLSVSVAKGQFGACLTGTDFAMVLPSALGIQQGRIRCGDADFRIFACDRKCSGSLISIVNPTGAKASPLWYSYDAKRGVTQISFDPRGLSFNTLSLEGQKGPTY